MTERTATTASSARTAQGPVTLTLDGDVAVLVIDHPPVNVSTAAVRAGLIAGINAASCDDAVAAVVITGAGRHFLSGSDLREFAAERLPEPQLPSVIAAIERCPKPVAAALSGATLGGGFELALGCDGRIALAGGVVGLPEVTLGLIPGAGGTQRTLRLVPPARVVDLVTSGARLPVEQAYREGLVDEVVTSSLRAESVRFARELPGKRILRDRPVLAGPPGAVEEAARDALARSGARPAVVAAVGAVLTGVAVPSRRGLAHERTEFERLRVGVESEALRHLFFARRTAEKANRPATHQPLGRVGVVGAGTMGAGIARALVEAGFAATLVDQDEPAARRAADSLRRGYERMVSAGRVSADEAKLRLELLSAGGAMTDLTGADLVVEAVFEDDGVKRQVLAEAEAITGQSVPLATNTSYLDIDALSRCLADPSRLVGMHFFNPAHRAAVLEIVRGAHSSARSMDTALTVARAMRKVPLIAGVCEGFIGNRIYSAYRRQCELMVEEGAAPHEVDAAMEGFGFAMGPFAVSDMSGLDVAWRMRQRRAAGRDPRERYPDVADRLCELGRFGQKTGNGWYHYEPGSRTPLPDPGVAELIAASRDRKGITPRAFAEEEIVRRALTAMANEAALLLAEGIAERAGDVDLMTTLGYGFPAHEGGIAFWAGRQDSGELAEEQRQLGEATGWGFRRGDLSLLAPPAA